MGTSEQRFLASFEPSDEPPKPGMFGARMLAVASHCWSCASNACCRCLHSKRIRHSEWVEPIRSWKIKENLWEAKCSSCPNQKSVEMKGWQSDFASLAVLAVQWVVVPSLWKPHVQMLPVSSFCCLLCCWSLGLTHRTYIPRSIQTHPGEHPNSCFSGS